MAEWTEPIDVVWIGMSLHYLLPAGKGQLIKDVHNILHTGGLFLIREPTLLEGESRSEWLDRFAAIRNVWATIIEDEFAIMESHMRLADYPESVDYWKAMGRQAGFANFDQLFMMPNQFGRVFTYWN